MLKEPTIEMTEKYPIVEGSLVQKLLKSYKGRIHFNRQYLNHMSEQIGSIPEEVATEDEKKDLLLASLFCRIAKRPLNPGGLSRAIVNINNFSEEFEFYHDIKPAIELYQELKTNTFQSTKSKLLHDAELSLYALDAQKALDTERRYVREVERSQADSLRRYKVFRVGRIQKLQQLLAQDSPFKTSYFTFKFDEDTNDTYLGNIQSNFGAIIHNYSFGKFFLSNNQKREQQANNIRLSKPKLVEYEKILPVIAEEVSTSIVNYA